MPGEAVGHPRQPLLHDETVVLSAPSQLWSSPDGSIGSKAIHGFYHSETRILSALALTANGESPEHLNHSLDGAGTVRISALLRHLDDRTADPRVRVDRVRTVVAGSLSETITLSNALLEPIETGLTLTTAHDFQSVHSVKGGVRDASVRTAASGLPAGIRLVSGTVTAEFTAAGASVTYADDAITTHWDVVIPAHGSVSVSWTITAEDTAAVVTAAAAPAEWTALALDGEDQRLRLWVDAALADWRRCAWSSWPRPTSRSSLRVPRGSSPCSAGTPSGPPGSCCRSAPASPVRRCGFWPGSRARQTSQPRPSSRARSCTSCGRGRSASTAKTSCCRRSTTARSMPPRSGSACSSTRGGGGCPTPRCEALLPNLEAARSPGCATTATATATDFSSTSTTTGHGLANQGWKDSGDSIQWRDGSARRRPDRALRGAGLRL